MVSPITAWLRTVDWTLRVPGWSPWPPLLVAADQSVRNGKLQVSVSQRMFGMLVSKRMEPINGLAKRDPVHDNYTLYSVGDDFAEPVYGVLRALAVPGTDHTTTWEERDFLRAGHTVAFRATKMDHFMVRLEVDSEGRRREFNASFVNHGGIFVLSIDVLPNS